MCDGLFPRRVLAAVTVGALTAVVAMACVNETSFAALRVCTTGDYKPLTYYDHATEQYSGIDIDMAKDFATTLHRTPVFVHTSWSELTKDLATLGKCDIAVGGISDTQARERVADFTQPYLTTGKTPLTTTARAKAFQSVDQIDRAGVRVIEDAGGTNEQFAKQHFPKATVIVWPDNTTIFDQLTSARADVMITDSIEALYQEKLHHGLAAVHPDKPFTMDKKAYMLPKGSALLDSANEWLSHRLTDGGFRRHYDRWMR
jgi:cyclohexadienyl dehydratase